MKQNSRIPQDDEIDLREITKTLWNEKILILSISLIFMVIGYVYGALQPKIYKTEITIREAPSYLFKPYHSSISAEQKRDGKLQNPEQNIAREFNDIVKSDLSSLDTLIQFFENNNKINSFKTYLIEKKINPVDYFKGKFESVKDKGKIVPNKYSLSYSQPLQGEIFLNNYIIFVKQQAVIKFKQQLAKSILHEITLYKEHLNIADKIELDYPILKSMVEGRSVVNEPEALFYKGKRVLSQQLINLNELLNQSYNLTLDYNYILEQASRPILVSKTPDFFMLIALVFGLFLSLILVFLKSIFQKKK